MTTIDRRTMRSTFLKAWAKAQTGQPLAPLETKIVQIACMHPQYHPFLAGGKHSLEQDFDPDAGEANPFLHMALHLATLDQVSTDQPAGIRRLYQRLARDTGDPHEAEHCIMECLATVLWKAQHESKPFNEKAYLKCIKHMDRDLRPQ